MEAITAMTPVRFNSEETVGPTTSMRRTSRFSPSAPLTLSLAAAWTFSSLRSLVGTCWATRISASLPDAHGLHLHVADAEPVELGAQLADVDRAGLGLHLDQRATLEVDAVVEAARHQQRTAARRASAQEMPMKM